MTLPVTTGTIAQRQLERFLALLVDGGPSVAEIEELFGPTFLASMPAQALAPMVARELQVAATEPLSVVAKGEHELVAVVLLANGRPARFSVREEEDPPHRFVGFDVGAAASVDGVRVPWDQLASSAPAASTESELPDALTAQLDALVAAHRRQHRTPGIIALV